MKKRKIMIISSAIGLFIILISLIGITYGYYIIKISGTPGSISATSGKLYLNYTGNWDSSKPGQVSASNIFPGWSKTLYFTINNPSTSTRTISYYLKWTDVINSIGSDFIYSLQCRVNSTSGTSCGTVTNVSFPSSNGTIPIPNLSNYVSNNAVSIPVNTTHYWTLTLQFKNQNYNQYSATSYARSINGMIDVDSIQYTQ